VRKERIASFQSASRKKIKLKEHQQIQDYLSQRRGSVSARNTLESRMANTNTNSWYNKMGEGDWDGRFVEQLFNLQKEQSLYQRSFGKRIDA
jgi:hypothetical protein